MDPAELQACVEHCARVGTLWLRLTHEGEKLYPQAFDLIHRREVNWPNEIWQADHTQLERWLLGERGQP